MILRRWINHPFLKSKTIRSSFLNYNFPLNIIKDKNTDFVFLSSFFLVQSLKNLEKIKADSQGEGQHFKKYI
jgi:hypothetical protein